MSSASTASSRQRVLHLYRLLQRTQNRTFQHDHPMQVRARAEIRRHFVANRNLTQAEEINAACVAAQEAADYLKSSVIQAKKVADGKYVATIKPEHTIADPPPRTKPRG